MTSTNMSSMSEIGIDQILNMVRKRFFVILVVMLIAGIAATLFTFLFQKDVYQARSTIIVSNTNTESGFGQLTVNDYNLNIKLVNSYSVICKTNRVLEQVIAELGLPMTTQALAGKITVSAAKDTEIIHIMVRDGDPRKAQAIANSVTRVFQSEVKEIMKMDNVQIIDEARLPGTPVSPNRPRNVMLGFAVGLMLGFCLAFLIEILDRTVKSEEQITELLGIPVLGSVPKIIED
ncbi:MAG: Wzz/FepE/Etk N-terminal domain-containing protein [Oscillospiraceae bacterium]|nr:Wzz/FepE/Etk N-terminal domain-containing protein [Oscillospiraceae bacterium]